MVQKGKVDNHLERPLVHFQVLEQGMLLIAVGMTPRAEQDALRYIGFFFWSPQAATMKPCGPTAICFTLFCTALCLFAGLKDVLLSQQNARS